jgi:brefeldin A-resistance guanine nucleotide exchange factor 1
MGPASAGECEDAHAPNAAENDSAFLVAGRSLLETEACVLTMALKRTGHQMWSRSSSMASAATASAVENSLHPTLLQGFLDLKVALVHMGPSLATVDPNIFLAPFLDVIRSEVVTGPVTGLALNAVNKILAYGLLHEKQPNIASAVENLADAVTHAR